MVINAVFTSRREVVWFLNLVGPDTLCDTNHPEELVDVVAGVAEEAAEDDEDVVDIVFAEDGVGDFFGGRHGFADSGDVGWTENKLETW